MPTPVNTAKQCLSPESIQALDEAISVANRRHHAQTTSLHAVSALLSLPSSPLREACVRARNSAYASRIQFKALELCLNVSLDRLPSTPQRVDQPPVSNSLMAAIKRSQANQRRQPENFHLYQQTTSSATSVSMVKVELQNLILSILDDPVVSRVFGESGFWSSDIKLSILRPVHRQLFPGKGQPIFLCNLNSSNNNNNYSFPFPGFFENNKNYNYNEIYKRINEVLVKKHGKSNPLLVGPTGVITVKVFLETLQKTKICGITNVISVKDEIFKFVNGDYEVGLLELKLEEVNSYLKENMGSGVIVEYGDLKGLIESNSLGSVSFVVKKLGGLLEVYGGRLWLIGCAESHEICVQFFNKFPHVEEEWGLHVLHIDSIRPAMAETFPKSSLMESFVPFGGFFSMPSDIKGPLRVSNHFGPLCQVCDEKFKVEMNDISKVGVGGSVVSDHYRSTLPSWLQTSQICRNTEMDVVQAQEDPLVVGAKVTRLQNKWHSICQRLHQSEPSTVGARVPSVVGFKVAENTLENGGSSLESGCDTSSKSNTKNIKDSPIVCSLSGSTTSGISVTTDLGLTRFDQKDYKLVYSSLFTRVGRQEEALGVISQTIAHCRAQTESKRGGIWFGFVGPDKVAKKKSAVALAEVLFGNKDNIICVDLSCHDLKLRGKNIVDVLADELIKKQLSVVFLENVDMADTLTQHHLSRAVSMGRFSDSYGREVSISNSIFVLTSKSVGVYELEKVNVDFNEENVLKAKCGSIRASTGFDLDDVKPSPKIVHVICKNKRKHGTNNHFLDLNLPADENDADYDFAPDIENTSAWLEDVLEHVDAKVIFKPFDFDSLTEKILMRIGECFENSVGLDSSLEIDFKLMEQILKASCFLDTVKVEDWIEQVLGEAFVEAHTKYGLGSHSVLKLIADELAEEQPVDILLPDRVIMT
ncbi:protein SMAX1-LIKE 8-like isoform X1 [Rutidosis leptorrhynchoides]|uniref:protein SMAX1-LIKE 8-like isoform X1 n=1 Tax=Rutidosis leptorrhynchoides TaxID=125765 RepID=UPI003A9A38DC